MRGAAVGGGVLVGGVAGAGTTVVGAVAGATWASGASGGGTAGAGGAFVAARVSEVRARRRARVRRVVFITGWWS